jgi:hypothetical protein
MIAKYCWSLWKHDIEVAQRELFIFKADDEFPIQNLSSQAALKVKARGACCRDFDLCCVFFTD